MKNLTKINRANYYDDIYRQCKKYADAKKYKIKVISLEKDRKLINKVKKVGLICENPTGEWNGYGYEKLPLAVIIFSIGQMRVFNKLKKERETERIKENNKPKKDPKDPKDAWVKRLNKLTGVPVEECLLIADEKLEYKEDQISRLVDRQVERFSHRRQKLINQIERSNPLRYIKNEEHAWAILAASYRHNNSDYESKLQLIHKYEADYPLTIEKGEAKELARSLSLSEIKDYFEEQL